MSKTAISALQEFLQKRRESAPIYTEITLGCADNPNFQCRCECLGLKANGEAANKKTAKHRAAGAMIKLLKEKRNHQIYYLEIESSSLTSPPRKSIFIAAAPSPPVSGINHIGKLQEMCVSRAIRQPEYRDIDSSGPSHFPQFTVECRIAHYHVSGIASTKKEAKQNAAGAMRELLKSERMISDVQEIQNLPQDESSTVEVITVNIDDLKVAEDPLVATATERARTKYPALRKRLAVVNDSPKIISIANYHEAFKASFDSNIIERFHAYYKSVDMTGNLSRVDLEAILQGICDILGVTYEEHRLKVESNALYVVAYKLTSKPSFTDVGMGPQLEVAHVDALRRLIGAIYVLLV